MNYGGQVTFDFILVFTQLKDLIPKAVRRLNVERQVTAAEVIAKYQRFAPEILNNTNILDNSWPKWFKNKILVIGVKNSAYAEEFYLKKKYLIEAINRSLGREEVYDLRTMVGIQLRNS